MKRKLLLGGVFLAVLGVLVWNRLPQNAAALANALVSMNDDDRNLALTQSQNINDAKKEELATLLLAHLENSDGRVRRFALYALRKMRTSDQRVVPAILNSLKDTEAEVRKEAAVGLAEQGEKAVPFLVTALEQENDFVARGVRIALQAMGPISIPALRGALRNANVRIRSNAAQILGELRPKPAEALPDLLAALKDTDLGVRVNAAVAVNAINPAETQTIPVHLEALKQKTWDVPLSGSVKALEALGPAAKPAAMALKNVLKISTDSVQNSQALRPLIAKALNAIEPRRSEVVDLFWDLKQKDPALRYRAAFNLSELSPAPNGAQTDLMTLLDDKDPTVAGRALFTLTRIGFNQSERLKKPLITKSIAVLARVNENQMEGLNEAVINALKKMEAGLVPATLMPLINGKDAAVKSVAARVLESLQKSTVQKQATPDHENN